MSLLRRLVKEFWLPALVAVLWTSYSLYTAPDDWDLTTIVNVFGPSFFLASWATGQFFRVRKQAQVESNLKSIETRLESVVSKLEQQAKDFAGHTLGAGGAASFLPMLPGNGFFELGLSNTSGYPVFDLHAEVIDLDEPIDPHNGKFWTRHAFSVPSIYPDRIRLGAYRFDLKNRTRLRVNVFISSRSFSGMQQFRVDNTGDHPRIAFRTVIDGAEIAVEVPADFPGYDPDKFGEFFN